MLVETMTAQDSLTFIQVAALTGLPAELLRKLVRDGVIAGHASWPAKAVHGTCNIDQAREIAARLHAARRPVEGLGIQAKAAADKYGFGTRSIYDWYERGWVRVLNPDSRYDRLYNEGDIAFARAIADLTPHMRGKPVFPQGKGPYSL